MGTEAKYRWSASTTALWFGSAKFHKISSDLTNNNQIMNKKQICYLHNLYKRHLMLFMLSPSPWERTGCRLYKLTQLHAALKNVFYTLSYKKIRQKGLPYQIIKHSHKSFELLFTNLPFGMGYSTLTCWRLRGTGLGFILPRIKKH